MLICPYKTPKNLRSILPTQNTRAAAFSMRELNYYTWRVRELTY